MQTIYLKNKIGLLVILTFLFTAPVFAQNAAATVSTGYDLFPIILVIVAGLLAFVIWGLARVLLMMARQNLNKTKTPKIVTTILVVFLLLTVQLASAQDAPSVDVAKEAVSSGPGYPGVYYILFSVLAMEVIVIIFLSAMIHRFSVELLPGQKGKLDAESKLKIWWANLGKKLTKAVPLDKEEDVVMDHEYDGIRELDNALPPWWKYGFYITIAFSVVYFFYYGVSGYGKNPAEEYNAQMAKAKIETEKYEATNKDKIDENNIPMADAAGLAVAKEIFVVKCFACHGKQGEGGAGPNLADGYWLHGGSLNDIYLSIKHGYPDKGMQAWSSVYSPKEISFLASFIETLKGTNPPNAKAPQGDLYEDATMGAKGNTAVSGTDTAGESKTSDKDSVPALSK